MPAGMRLQPRRFIAAFLHRPKRPLYFVQLLSVVLLSRAHEDRHLVRFRLRHLDVRLKVQRRIRRIHHSSLHATHANASFLFCHLPLACPPQYGTPISGFRELNLLCRERGSAQPDFRPIHRRRGLPSEYNIAADFRWWRDIIHSE
jgi:hypothetical protein